MAAVVKTAIQIDDEMYMKGQEIVNRLIKENELLRDVLELQACRSELAQRSVIEKTDEGVQTEL